VDSFKNQLDRLSELNDEQVSELQAGIITEFESIDENGDLTPESVDAMTTLADMLETVRGEVQRREAQAEELVSMAAEATNRVYGDGESEEMIPAEEEEEAPMATEPEMVEETEEPTAPTEDEIVEEVPMTMPEEDEDEMSEASTVSDENAEFSTDEEPEVVEEVVDGSADVDAPVAEFSADEEVVPAETAEPAPAEEAPVVEEAVVASVEGSEEAEAPTEEITDIAPEAQEEAPVTAAAEGAFEAPADRRPVAQAAPAVPVAITAGADIPGYTAGSTLTDMSEVAQAFEKRLHTLRRVNGGDGEQHIVASLSTQYPEARILSSDPEENRAKIDAVVGPDAIIASGGFATPLEVKYDVFGLGTSIRPVRDSLPRFQADRGGIRYVTPPVLSSYANAVGIWTAANDSAETPGTKASLTVTAAAELTAVTDAVTLQMQFGNLFTRAYPELLARHNELGLIQHAREAEQNLLSRIATDSTAVTTTSLIGFGRDFLVQIRRAAAAYRSRHRIDISTQLRAIIPSWVYDAIAADLTLSMPGDGTISISVSEINGYLATSNVTLVASLDQNVFGSQGVSALVEFPDSFTWYLFAEGTFIFLDGGTLDLGIIRDSTLVGTNDYKMFVETFEGIAKVGTEALAITSTININGTAAALRDTTGGTAAATIEY
jgi:chemotaxis protein histidine kinase CheA